MSTNLQQVQSQNDNMYSQSLDSLNAWQQQVVIDQQINQQVDYNLQEAYMPSSSEKKKCVLMYILFWVLIMMWKKEITEFEYFHMKQSMWRWVIFLIVFILSVIFIFIPFIRLLWILPLVSMVGVWLYFIYQVWNWKFNSWKSGSLWFFAWFWWRILWLFQLDIKIIWKQYPDGEIIS